MLNYHAVCASTDKETSIFTVTNQIPHLSSGYTMYSSNSTTMASKYANIGLKFLLPSSQILFSWGSNFIYCSHKKIKEQCCNQRRKYINGRLIMVIQVTIAMKNKPEVPLKAPLWTRPKEVALDESLLNMLWTQLLPITEASAGCWFSSIESFGRGDDNTWDTIDWAFTEDILQ